MAIIQSNQQFRLFLRDYLNQYVVDKLRAGENATITVDKNVFDYLFVGRRFTPTYEAVTWLIGEYARTILFYEFNIRTSPSPNIRNLSVSFPVKESVNAPEMPEWDPLPTPGELSEFRRKMASLEVAAWMIKNKGLSNAEASEAFSLSRKKRGGTNDQYYVIFYGTFKTTGYIRYSFDVTYVGSIPDVKFIAERQQEDSRH